MRAQAKTNGLGGASARGSVLIEVIVAVVILGVFVGVLCDAVQSACGTAVALRHQARTLGNSSAERSSAPAWSWGAMVDSVEWAPGPELTVQPGEGCDGTVKVGVWSDGWLVGEWPVASAEFVRLGSATWLGMTGREVIVRIRGGDEAWGPPWRTVVPTADGLVDYAGPGPEPVEDESFEEASSVMHARWLGAFCASASWSTDAISKSIEGAVGRLVKAESGVCALEFEGRMQTWLNHEDRRIDVYW